MIKNVIRTLLQVLEIIFEMKSKMSIEKKQEEK
jgi:hypothetical protein